LVELNANGEINQNLDVGIVTQQSKAKISPSVNSLTDGENTKLLNYILPLCAFCLLF
jgi:hypothetical protein